MLQKYLAATHCRRLTCIKSRGEWKFSHSFQVLRASEIWMIPDSGKIHSIHLLVNDIRYMCYFYFLKLAFFLVCLVFAERRHNFDFGIRQETDRRWFRMYKARKQRSLWVSLSVSDEFTCCVLRENRVWVGISVSVFLVNWLVEGICRPLFAVRADVQWSKALFPNPAAW